MVSQPEEEEKRLSALRSYAILDTPAEASFDDLTHLAAQICETPIALISLVDRDRLWFKSKFGMNTAEVSRNKSFCAMAIDRPDRALIVGDAAKDARFSASALVTSAPHVRFYAGAPLVTPGGHALGTLCVIDHKPRQLGAEQVAALETLGKHVVAQMELRRNSIRLVEEIYRRERAEATLREQNELREQESTRLLDLAEKSRQALLSVLEDEQRAGQPMAESGDNSGYLSEVSVTWGDSRSRLGQGVLELNRELSDLSRQLASANADLAQAVGEKEALRKETHHRVKNNLALITSLMRLEGRRSVPETRATLKEMEARVHSVALLNETLYKTANYSRVNLSDYLRQIATHIYEAHAPRIGAVELALELDPVHLETSQAIPCGLIVNELITNSLKHAFPGGRSGEVRLSLRPDGNGKVRLGLVDTGIGLPDGFVLGQTGSLGLNLAEDLARQLGGRLEAGPGPAFSVTFPVREYDPKFG